MKQIIHPKSMGPDPRGFTEEDDLLLAELGVGIGDKVPAARTPCEERIVAGFGEIGRFVDEHGRTPQHGGENDIFERLCAVRLDRLRERQECRNLLVPLDRHGLLDGAGSGNTATAQDIDDEALLDELGVVPDPSPITELRHVRSVAERKAAAEIANRQQCEDFATFRPLFDAVQKDLDSGVRETRPFELKAEIETGRFFIVGGQKAYVAGKGETTLTDHGRTDARLRVIFDNGTESNMLMRSLQRALNKDDAGRRITEPAAGPLFAGHAAGGDVPSGTVYVLRSRSGHPLVAQNRDLVHKIGVTHMSVERRIAGARLQPTFLMANVDIVATYDLYNIDRSRLERLIHRVFEPARLDIEVPDRFGRPVAPQEWFLVPLPVIDEAVARIRDETIGACVYDPESASLVDV